MSAPRLYVYSDHTPSNADVNSCNLRHLRLVTNNLLYGNQRSPFVSEVHLQLHAFSVFDDDIAHPGMVSKPEKTPNFGSPIQ